MSFFSAEVCLIRIGYQKARQRCLFGCCLECGRNVTIYLKNVGTRNDLHLIQSFRVNKYERNHNQSMHILTVIDLSIEMCLRFEKFVNVRVPHRGFVRKHTNPLLYWQAKRRKEKKNNTNCNVIFVYNIVNYWQSYNSHAYL